MHFILYKYILFGVNTFYLVF